LERTGRIGREEIVKRISPIEGILSLIEAMRDSSLGNGWWREGALTDDLPNGIVVDTIMEGFDTGVAETGIMREGVYDWKIVDQYSTEEEAREGHAKWVALMKANPDILLEDIGIWEGVK
jgi:hypothetical protein